MHVTPPTMDSSLKKKDQQVDDSLFPTAVSEQDLEEARYKSVQLKQLFGPSKLTTPGHNYSDCRPDLQADFIIRNKAFEHYSKGEEAMRQFQFEKAVICYSKAMTLQPNQSQFYVRQAEAYLQLCDFQSAAAGYKHASVLEPGDFHIRMAFIYYLQGQCLFDRGLFLEALESFSKAAELKPHCRAYQMRRLACLTALGRYSDCLQLVTDWIESDSQTADLYTLRARLYLKLNQVTQCYHDAKSALALNPTCPETIALLSQLEESGEQVRQEAVSKALSGRLPEALSKINTALQHLPENERYYLFRGILYRHLKDFTASIEDLVLAIELSEQKVGHSLLQEEPRAVQEEDRAQLVLTYNDFAVQCSSRGFHPEAILLLNKAIQEEKRERGLYMNRGDCFFKQEEWSFALADYQQAEEMSPNDPAIWARLAVLHNTMGSHSFQERQFQEAADRFSLAIKYNPCVCRYYENRAKAFHKVLNLQGTMKDTISTLILDPANDEALTLLMSLSPGCTVSDILSSETGQTVRRQLMEKIQPCHSPGFTTSGSDAGRLCSDLERMAVANEDTESVSLTANQKVI